MPYAVALGEMFDGINFYGPFVEFEDAERWAGGEIRNNSWWIVDLQSVDPVDQETLVIPNVDMEMLKQQYERLQEVVVFVEEWRKVPGSLAPDASILDGIVEMLGDQFELPAYSPEEK